MTAAHLALKLNKGHLWPIEDFWETYSEEDLFDVIEFLYLYVSKPTNWSSAHAGCAHYDEFDRDAGRQEFRSRINETLKYYKDGHELTEHGDILASPEHGLEGLVNESLPETDMENVQARIDAAIQKFRRRNASLDDKRDAVKALADVFEFLRDDLEKAITKKDESDLFNIANNFGIRHHNDQQKTDYDRVIWYDWMFYYYLATVHVVIKRLKQQDDDI